MNTGIRCVGSNLPSLPIDTTEQGGKRRERMMMKKQRKEVFSNLPNLPEK